VPGDRPFLDRLRAGEPTYMLGVRGSRTPEIARLAAASGHHALLVDLEHSTMSVDVAAQICAAAGDLGLASFVRIPEGDCGIIGRLLDGGAHGVVAPRTETPEQAAAVAAACRFPPAGHRSQIATLPQLGMRPVPARESNPALNAATVVQVLLETPSGIDRADAIAAVAGVDVLAIGVNDLTAELGIPGSQDDRSVRAAVAQVGEACRRHGKLMMIGGVRDLSVLASLTALGACPLLLTGMDTELLMGAAQARVDALGQWYEATRSAPQAAT
jgi:2-keto-3-deoxy-L-rhamnonate aldolase RhmA